VIWPRILRRLATKQRALRATRAAIRTDGCLRGMADAVEAILKDGDLAGQEIAMHTEHFIAATGYPAWICVTRLGPRLDAEEVEPVLD
jgi:hypothetical protein